MRDHGGDLDRARATFGGAADDWIDLSTGINRRPYPLPDLPDNLWRSLPDATLSGDAIEAARTAYQTQAACLPLAGAQAAIQLIPRAFEPGPVCILSPTYNEHAANFAAAGWHVRAVKTLDGIPDGEAAVVVNPNNPDGRSHAPADLLELAGRVPLLVVDESFADMTPEVSLAAHPGRPGLIVLRSFGKFFGLAGVRLGFALGHREQIDRLAAMAGPWAVSGPALAIGAAALCDHDWAARTRRQLAQDAARLDQLGAGARWSLVGGTSLFRLYDVGAASAEQARLARHHIWSRVFPDHPNWLRLGLPGPQAEWDRLSKALS